MFWLNFIIIIIKYYLTSVKWNGKKMYDFKWRQTMGNRFTELQGMKKKQKYNSRWTFKNIMVKGKGK